MLTSPLSIAGYACSSPSIKDEAPSLWTVLTSFAGSVLVRLDRHPTIRAQVA